MLLFPHAKINLGLYITEKRPDGYHNIETLFYPIGLADGLEILPCTFEHKTSLHVAGVEVAGDDEDNLVMRAYRLMQQRFPDQIPVCKIFLHKEIPTGAGLGGGSSDAAYMLRLCRQQFNLALSDQELATMAATLGADCPFFIYNTPLLARGIGNEFSAVNLSLKGYYLVVVKPPVHISTVEAYAGVIPASPKHTLEAIIEQPIATWKHLLVNDFEKSIFSVHPELQAIKEKLYNLNAVYASMSGSGSSLFGLFRQKVTIPQEWSDYFVWQEELKD